MRCGDPKTAEQVFERCAERSMHLYGAMMKNVISASKRIEYHRDVWIDCRECEEWLGDESCELVSTKPRARI